MHNALAFIKKENKWKNNVFSLYIIWFICLQFLCGCWNYAAVNFINTSSCKYVYICLYIGMWRTLHQLNSKRSKNVQESHYVFEVFNFSVRIYDFPPHFPSGDHFRPLQCFGGEVEIIMMAVGDRCDAGKSPPQDILFSRRTLCQTSGQQLDLRKNCCLALSSSQRPSQGYF